MIDYMNLGAGSSLLVIPIATRGQAPQQRTPSKTWVRAAVSFLLTGSVITTERSSEESYLKTINNSLALGEAAPRFQQPAASGFSQGSVLPPGMEGSRQPF